MEERNEWILRASLEDRQRALQIGKETGELMQEVQLDDYSPERQEKVLVMVRELKDELRAIAGKYKMPNVGVIEDAATTASV